MSAADWRQSHLYERLVLSRHMLGCPHHCGRVRSGRLACRAEAKWIQDGDEADATLLHARSVLGTAPLVGPTRHLKRQNAHADYRFSWWLLPRHSGGDCDCQLGPQAA